VLVLVLVVVVVLLLGCFRMVRANPSPVVFSIHFLLDSSTLTNHPDSEARATTRTLTTTRTTISRRRKSAGNGQTILRCFFLSMIGLGEASSNLDEGLSVMR
jgi:hypothetical protein